MKLFIVESPTKAKTIGKYLGGEYKVLASMGHIRNLPSKDGSVDVNNNFKIKYEILPKSAKIVKDFVEIAKKSDSILLAPDPDREGEAIAWSILEVLKQKKAITDKTKIERITYNAITKSSIEEALKNPRDIDLNLVNAQQARVALDYLMGFTLSPVLWRKLPGSKSAGRVQSVALRIICDRELEIEAFKPQEYWTLDINLKTNKNEKVLANLYQIEEKKVDKFFITNEKDANNIKSILEGKKYKVIAIDKKEVKRNPYPPFTTSTLQQEANKKLGFSTKTTMSVAQSLYEGKDIGSGTYGLITYMRTDGVYIDPSAISSVRNFILDKYGKDYLPDKPIIYKNKVKNAQEAHEAIRPTNPSITPDSVKKYLTDQEYKLYDLIWKRLVASQMNSVIYYQTAVSIETESKYAILKTIGNTIKFDGFYVLYNIKKDEDDEKDDIDKENTIPVLKEGDYLDFDNIKLSQHWTEPPARYSEASLVKKMEELGIGRPSTYATILNVIQEREYVKLEKKRFIPQERGIILTAFLKNYFTKYIEYDYTAKLEEDLDVISNGNKGWIEFLQSFWDPFSKKVEDIANVSRTDITSKVSETLKNHIFGFDKNGDIKDKCPLCSHQLVLKMGKTGVFIGCSDYPNCKYTKSIHEFGFEEGTSNSDERFESKLLGTLNNKNIYLKKGPYGFYLQEGEDSKTEKPRRFTLRKLRKPEDITIEGAKQFLSLPRIIGNDKNGNEIKSNIGRFGPYLQCEGHFFSVKDDDILTMSLDRAIEIIEEAKTKSPEKYKEPKKEDIKTTKKTSSKSPKTKKNKK